MKKIKQKTEKREEVDLVLKRRSDPQGKRILERKSCRFKHPNSRNRLK